MGKPAKVVRQAFLPDILVGATCQMGIFKRLASVHVDHGVSKVFVAVLSSDKVPSGLRIMGTSAVRKLGWLGHGAGVIYNVMRPLPGKGSLLAVQTEAVAWDSNSVDVVIIAAGSMARVWTGRDTVGGYGGLDTEGIFTLRADGGMFTLGDAGGSVTLGYAGGIGTRGDGGIDLFQPKTDLFSTGALISVLFKTMR